MRAWWMRRHPAPFFIWPVACKPPRADTPLGRKRKKGASMRNVLVAAAAGFAATIFSTGAMAGKDLDAIKARGSLVCGVGTGTAGFMMQDSQGKWVGLDVDVCRAVSAAIFGDSEKVKYVGLTSQQ